MFAVSYSSELDHAVRRKLFENREDAEEWIENFYQTCLNYPCSGYAVLLVGDDLFEFHEDIEEDD